MSTLDYGVVDIHVHIQPWEQLKPAVRARMESRPGSAELARLLHDPGAVLDLMDEAGVERIGVINYVSPDLMGFTSEVNELSAGFARHAPERFIAFGSVHPRFTADCERARSSGCASWGSGP